MGEYSNGTTMLDFKFGAKGWSFDLWVDDFYPHDLPKNWRLPYYANEFSTVLVPQCDWLNSPPNTIENWALEVSEGFRFFLNLSITSLIPNPNGIVNYLYSIRQAISGVIIELDTESEVPCALIKDLVQLNDSVPLILDGNITNPIFNLKNNEIFDLCWRPQRSLHRPIKNNFALAIHPSEQIVSPREIKQKIDELCEVAKHTEYVYFFFEHPKGAIRSLKDAKIIANLS